MTYTNTIMQHVHNMSPLQQRRWALFAARIFLIVMMLLALSLRAGNASTERGEQRKQRATVSICEPAFAAGDVIGSPFVMSHRNLSDYLTCR